MYADGSALSERPVAGVCADGPLSVVSCLHPPTPSFSSPPHPLHHAARSECAQPGLWALGEHGAPSCCCGCLELLHLGMAFCLPTPAHTALSPP